MTAKSKTYFIYLIPAIVLTIPLAAMQFTEEVNWTGMDFIIAGILLFGTAFMIHQLSKKINSRKSKIILFLVIFIMMLLLWAELAVGIFGTPIAGS